MTIENKVKPIKPESGKEFTLKKRLNRKASFKLAGDSMVVQVYRRTDSQ